MENSLRNETQGLPPSLQELERLQGGPQAISAVWAAAGQWVLVYQLRPLELILYVLHIPFRPYHPVMAVIYDPAERVYCRVPAGKVFGKSSELVRGPLYALLARL